MPTIPPFHDAPGTSFESFARAARRLPRLDPVQEREVARRSAGGDLAARRALVASELRVALFHAGRHRASGVPRADLVQEGALALLRAAERFDPDRGVRFATFAGPWVRHAVAEAARRGSAAAHLPASDRRRIGRLRRLHAAGASDAAAADALALDEDYLRALRSAVAPTRGLDAADGPRDGPGDAHDADAWLERLAREEARTAVRRLVGRLPARERRVVAERFGLDGRARTHDEIGADLGISGERVRRILARALARLRAEPALQSHRLAA